MAPVASNDAAWSERFRAVPQPGEVIDRHRPVSFSFNGQPVGGRHGDTIVSALVANGLRAYAQGRRLQSKRGVLSGDRFDPCRLQVDDEPNVLAAHRLVAAGQRVRSQHVWPSLRFDLKAVNQRAARLLRPDSQLRASTATGFLRPAYRWLASRGDIGGRLAEVRVPGHVGVGRRHVDVLVVGGGLAGLVAAEAAATAGARTLLVEADRELGGWLRLAGDTTLGEVMARLGGLAGLEVCRNAVVVDLDRDGQAVVVTEGDASGDPAEDLIVVRARHVILAAGLVERTLTFTGNDLPGVMLATAARRLVDLWAVRPGERAVVLTANSHGDAAAADLERVGVEVAEVVDARRGGSVQRANGSGELAEVVLGDRRAVAADCLVVAPGWTVDGALAERAGANVVYDGAAGRPTVEGRPGQLGVVGALAGDASLEQVVAHATVSGRQGAAAALRGSLRGVPVRPLTSVVGAGSRRAAPPQPPLGSPADELNVASVSVGVVDFAEDVTAFELVGAEPVTTARLLSSAATAPALGSRARAELSDLARRLPGVADLTLPLLTGRGGAVEHFAAGPRLGSLARLAHRPVRRTALADEHAAAGGRLEAVGEWLDVAHYGDPAGERRCLDEAGGLCDVGRSGLFDVQGPDAGRLVNLLIGTPLEPDAAGDDPVGPDLGGPDVSGPLPLGGVVTVTATAPATGDRSRPFVVARRGDQHWQIRVDADHAAATEGMLLTLVHIEHRNWQVYVASVGEGEAGIALVGSRAADVAEAALGVRPHTDAVTPLPDGPLGPGHVWSYPQGDRRVVELRVPAGRAVDAWRALVAAGRSRGVEPVGFLALEGSAG